MANQKKYDRHEIGKKLINLARLRDRTRNLERTEDFNRAIDYWKKEYNRLQNGKQIFPSIKDEEVMDP